MTGNGRAVGQEWNERCFANFHAHYGQYTYCITASNQSDGWIHIFNRKVNNNKSKRISLFKNEFSYFKGGQYMLLYSIEFNFK
jgi:hypothetical protein